MFKKTLITLGLLGATTLSGCVVYAPPRPRYVYSYGYVDGPPAAVVVAPVPVFGFYGGYYRDGWYRGGGHWRR
jgi:hypothetical protein